MPAVLPLSTGDGTPGVNASHKGKFPAPHFTAAQYAAAITPGQVGYSADLWSDGFQFTVENDAAGAIRVWSSTLGHGRTMVLADGRVTTLPAENTSGKNMGRCFTAADQASSPGSYAGGQNGTGTMYFKREVEANIRAVRMIIRSNAPITLADYVFVVASTETGSSSSALNEFTPIVGGTSRNYAVDNDGLGWRASSMATASSAVPSPSTSNGTIYQYISDWVPIRLVPRADGGVRPIIMGRLEKRSAFAYSSGGGTVAAVDSAKPWSRLSRMQWVGGAAGVTDLSAYPSTVAASPGNCPDVSFQYDFDVPVRGFLIPGDSISANFEADGWAARVIRSLSTPDAPCCVFNTARSGVDSNDYVTIANNTLSMPNFAMPTDLIMPDATPNDPKSLAANDVRIGRCLQLFRRILDADGRVFVWNSCPNDAYGAAQEAVRIDAQAWSNGLAAQGLITVVPMGQAVTTGNPGRYVSGATGDGTHPNLEVGVPLMAPVMQPAVTLP